MDESLYTSARGTRSPIVSPSEASGAPLPVVYSDSSDSVPFSDQDWHRIREWASRHILTPIVVIVGFGWWPKVRAQADHWMEFLQWLREAGVDDGEACVDALDQLDRWDIPRLMTTLARYSAGLKEGTLRSLFRRRFKGVAATTRQESFGKMHLAVTLDYFWQVPWRSSPSLSSSVDHSFRQADANTRVATLACCPAWHTLKTCENLVAACHGYPFQRVPPWFEFLRFNFVIDDPRLVPVGIHTTGELQSYVREVVLAHATRGNLPAVRQRLRDVRQQPHQQDLERQMRMILSSTSFG